MLNLMMDMPLTITSIMEFAEKSNPDTEIVSVTADNPRHRYHFSDAFRRTRQLANVLKKLGLNQGDRVATLAWNDYRHFELYYAISCMGMICHTINPRLFEQQIEFIVNHAEDRVLFTDVAFLPMLESIQDKLPTIEHFIILTSEKEMPETSLRNASCYEVLLEAEDDGINWPGLAEDTPCSLCYTSGTTGNPKGVLYNHRSTVLHAYASALPDAFCLSRSDVVLPVVPMFHVNSWGVPYTAAMTGSKLVFPGPKMADGETLTQLINSEKVTVSLGVPTVWLALINYLKESGKNVPSLERVIAGGAACSLSIMETLEDEYGVYTNVVWGMTEMSPLGTFNAKLDRAALGEDRYRQLRAKAGRSLYGVEMKIVDDDNHELPWDGVAFGFLKVRGPWVASGYYRQEHNDAHDSNGWFDTGDVATIDMQGYMQITDRSKDVIKSGGEWISSIELENIAVDHPLVEEAAVVGMPHPKWTERPLLFVVKGAGSDLSKDEILDWFAGKVAKWWIPEDCLFVADLPHTATGKLSKKDLREKYGDYEFP